MALTPLQAASNLPLQASDARESLPQLIFVALHATNLRQLLEDVPFFFVRKTLLECSLFVADTLDPGGEPFEGEVFPHPLLSMACIPEAAAALPRGFMRPSA